MKKLMKVCAVMMAMMLSVPVCTATPHRGSDRGRIDYRGHYDGGRHYGYHRNKAGELVFELLGLGVAAAVVSSINHHAIYVEQPPRVVYQVPQVIQQPIVIQQVQNEALPPVTITVNIQNSNGSFTPVTLRKIGAQWVGPKGEYYNSVPSVGQLRPVYGF